MHSHRFQLPMESPVLPEPPVPTMAPSSFMLCPNVLLQGLSPMQLCWQCYLYQRAFEEAQAVVRPSLPERDLLGVWN